MHNFYGLSEESMKLVEEALVDAPPPTDDQAREIGRIMGLIPVDHDGKPII